MLKVGITGSFGAGKSTVAAMFRKRGAVVVDTDGIVHKLLKKDARCLRRIKRAFGDDFVTKKGVDRIKLGALAFSDPTALHRLERILHPLVWEETRHIFSSGRGRAVVVDAPVLIEAGWHKNMDVVVVVKAGLEDQIERIERRMGFERKDVLKRIRCQMPLRDKLKYADFVVDNHGSKADTDRQVTKIWKIFQQQVSQED